MTGETMFAEMKRYVRFTEDDTAALRAFGAVAEPHFAPIAAEFYDRIRGHDEAHAVILGEEQIVRLRRSLVQWMKRLCTGPHDEVYFAERSKIGRIHVKVGLPQRYMFTGMALLRSSFEAITADLPDEHAGRVRHALTRILDLELAIMLETYHEDFVARLRAIERHDRAHLEEALARSELRYTRAVEQARVMVIGLTAQGTISLFNLEAERLSGYARDEVLGQPFVTLLLPPEEQGPGGVHLGRALRGELTHDAVWEVPLQVRSGKQRMVRWSLAHAPDERDPEVVVFAVGRDIASERLLAERTKLSEKLAAVGTLAAGLAHEIRNPLNGALLHVTFLERSLARHPAGADATDAARFIGAEIRRLSALVTEFLVFARPAPLALVPTSLGAVCARTLAVMTLEAAAARVELVGDFPTADVVLRLDAGKMEQVLINLVKNAIEAVASVGGGHVTVRVRRAPRAGIVEIEDDGPGVSTAEGPIFDAFFSTKPHGTGLGLAIVHRVVTDHGGAISYESRPGRTVFHVELPLGEEEAP
jgi:PAS domain S-box-containing protein